MKAPDAIPDTRPVTGRGSPDRARRARVRAERYRLTENVGVFLVLALMALVMGSPLLWMISTSLKPEIDVLRFPPQWIPDPAAWENYPRALQQMRFAHFLRNSLIITVGGMAGVLFSSAVVGYGFARLHFPGKTFLFIVVVSTMMLPPQVTIIPQFILTTKLGLLNSLPGLVLVYSAGAIAFNMFLLRGFFETLPRELEESALIDGANHLTIFVRIMVPLARPALSTVAVFSFLGAWDEYIWALTVLTDLEKRTLPIVIANFRGQHASDWGLVFAASLTAVVPTILLFIFFQRYFVKGITAGALKG